MKEDPADTPLALPRLTTPTWEMELLISAASAFALLQVLGVQQEAFLRMAVWFNESHMQAMLTPLYLYARIVLICLSGAFIIHLATRAYWVGLIGLNSIFPDGPDFSKFKYGPFQRRLIDASKPDTDALIEKADNRATLVFSFGVGLALIMVLPVLMMAVAIVATLILAPFFGYEQAMSIALIAVLGPFIVTITLPSMIDQLLGKHIAPDSLVGQGLTKAFSGLSRLSINTSGNALTMFLFSRMKGVKSAALASALIGMLLSLVAFIGIPRLAKIATQMDVVSGLEASDYAVQRAGSLEYANRAFIPAPFISGRYLDLTVPVPANDIPTDQPVCVTAKNEKQRRNCLRQTLAVHIDGKPTALTWLEQKASPGRTMALRAFIDISDLATGQHVLTIDYAAGRKSPDESWREIINFWN
jgi:hypothetical protein